MIELTKAQLRPDIRASRMTVVWIIILGAVLTALVAVSSIQYWYRSSVFRIAITEHSARYKPLLKLISDEPGLERVNVEIVEIKEAELGQHLADRRIDLAITRLSPTLPVGLKSVYVLGRLPLATGAPTTPPVADLLFASGSLQNFLPQDRVPSSLMVYDGAAAELPDTVLTRDKLQLTEDEIASLWFLGLSADDTDANDKKLPWRDLAVSVHYHLVGPASIDKYQVRDLISVLNDRLRDMRATMPIMRGARVPRLDDATSPLRAHDGVAVYINREQLTFIERYGELIYIVLTVIGIAISLLVSTRAWNRRKIDRNAARYFVDVKKIVEFSGSNPPPSSATVSGDLLRLQTRLVADVLAHRMSADSGRILSQLIATVRSDIGTTHADD
jgi:hypothetical protein